ncbi:MAG: VOC family protein [bacterium]
MNTTETFCGESGRYIVAFENWVLAHKPDAIADHICYKCDSTREFESIRTIFEPESGLIYQSIIAGRRIAIIKLPTPITTSLGDIKFLELSDQKPDGSQTSGFDHIEIFPRTGTMEELVASLESSGAKFEKVVRPHHTTFDTTIFESFKIRLEPESLIAKIKREEMK